MDHSTSFLVTCSSSQHLSNPFLSSSNFKQCPSINVLSKKISTKKPCIYNSKSIPPTKCCSQIKPHIINQSSSNYVSQDPNKLQFQETSKFPKPLPFLNNIFNAIDDFIIKFLDPPPRPSINPKVVLADNFSPVLDELPPTACEVVKGSIPPCLHGGAYIRNGPNPQFLPMGPHHLFNGNGMLHCIKIDQQGNSTLCSRFVKTNRYLADQSIGRSIYTNIFITFNGLAPSATRLVLFTARLLARQFDFRKGIGLANTSVASLFSPGNLLFAMEEADLPYQVKITPDGDIITIGRHDFSGLLERNMTAHPKTDPDTGEVFAFKYGGTSPYLTYFRFSPEGKKEPDVPISSIPGPSFIHDMAITKRYVIFPDIQVGINPNLTPEILFSGVGSLVGPDPRKVPRIGVILRYSKDQSEMKWFDVPGFNILHATNAWDEDDGDSIVLIAPNILTFEHTLEDWDLFYSVMMKIKIDLKTGVISRQRLSSMNLEFGVINPAYVSKKNKYVYACVNAPAPKMGGVVKLDISMAEQEGDHDCVVASRMYGNGCYGGETYFVAKEIDNPNAEEDDGYIMTFVHNENSEESTFLIMDAKSPTLDIVVELKLPRRVPYGFHGLFVRQTDLLKL
ncbi:oxygenase [Lithospermum erythrorhizon]|uniref:Oxygenase n=1 Tax=Lithospermum erythrorhizon TaxID=34254 RepID=A0AAV3NJT6_LITER